MNTNGLRDDISESLPEMSERAARSGAELLDMPVEVDAERAKEDRRTVAPV
jgi:hypothetical protein